MNIIGSAVNFGLGPVGKLCTIVNELPNLNWYACGDQFDLNIFKGDVFKECCFSRSEDIIKDFIKKNSIKYALVVLDGELATLFKRLGLIVIYIDSLPFMWKEEDILNGDVPLNVDYYCAQKTNNKCDNKVLDKINNLLWINPIVPIQSVNKDKKEDYYIINLGGLSVNNELSQKYIDNSLIYILDAIRENKLAKRVLITSGSIANSYIKELLNNYSGLNIEVKTLKHDEFIDSIYSCNTLITTPGLTTLLETVNFKKPTIILPPNNLSQYYNQEIAANILYKYKIISWPFDNLSSGYVKSKESLNEEELVNIIQDNIKAINDLELLKDYFKKEINEDLIINKNYKELKLDGAKEVRDIINSIGSE